MGRAVATKGHSGRRLGRTIHRLEASVELSSKECSAKKAEQEYKEKTQQTCGDADSPVQNLQNLAASKKDQFSS